MATRLALNILGSLCTLVMCLSAARSRRKNIAGAAAVVVVVAKAQMGVGRAGADVV